MIRSRKVSAGLGAGASAAWAAAKKDGAAWPAGRRWAPTHHPTAKHAAIAAIAAPRQIPKRRNVIRESSEQPLPAGRSEAEFRGPTTAEDSCRWSNEAGSTAQAGTDGRRGLNGNVPEGF